MNKNELILYKLNKLEISELTDEEQNELAKLLVDEVNIKKLEEQIKDLILWLSSAAPPSFGADARYIALDNQKRLEIIHKLLYNFNMFKSYVKKAKRIKGFEDDESYSFLRYTESLISGIYEYGYYRKEDIEIQLKQLEERKSKTYNILEYIDNIKYLRKENKEDEK